MKTLIKTAGIFQWAVLLLLIAWLGWAISILWPADQPEVTLTLAHDPDCDLRTGPCNSRLPDGTSIGFSIEPRSIPLLETLQLNVEMSAQDVDQVIVDINGVDMNMGINQVKLQKQAAGRYTGKADLSVCIFDVMEWEAKVLVYQAKQIIEVPFRFITVK